MKTKAVAVIVAFILIAALGFMAFAIIKGENSKPKFADDGFVIAYDETDSGSEGKVYYFTEGTKYSFKYPDQIKFVDTEGETISVKKDSFVHYNSGDVASLSDSVLVNLDEVDSSAVNYYGLSSDMLLDKSGSAYSIDSQSGNIGLEELLWKTGNNRYLLAADDIFVSVASGNEYQFKDFVELYYYDSGMLSIISPDGVVKTASADCYITTGNGATLNASNKTVVDNGQVKFCYDDMNFTNEETQPLVPASSNDIVEYRIPEFKFNVIDGVNGESGIDGEAGEAGESGTDGMEGMAGSKGTAGVDGKNGDNGTNGINGINGENGEAGEAGTAGESGKLGEAGADGADGEKGQTGVTGESGATGVSGLDGAAGMKGAEGQAGAAGQDGDMGLDGYEGAAGSDGVRGAKGASGAAGAQGYDGERGFDGDAGFEGEAGSNGKAGGTGTTGVLGANGLSGLDGTNGAHGTDGTDGETPADIVVDSNTDYVKELPVVKLNSLNISNNKIEGTLAIDNIGVIPPNADAIKVFLFDAITGEIVNSTVSGYENPIEFSTNNNDGFSFGFPELRAKREYILMATCDYQLNGITYNGVFLNKQFSTDPLGAEIKIHSVSQNSITYEISNPSGEQTHIKYEVRSGDGLVSFFGENNISTSGEKLNLLTISDIPGAIKEKLKPDTDYYFSISEFGSITDPKELINFRDIYAKTLKVYPEISGAVAVEDRMNNRFELSLNKISTMEGINNFRYEIYQKGDTRNPVKVIYTNSKDGVICPVDGSQITAEGVYVFKAVAEFFDNYQTVELSSEFSNEFGMSGFKTYPWIETNFENDPNAQYPNKADVKLKLFVPGDLTLKNDGKVVIQYNNGINGTQTKYFDLPAVHAAENEGDTPYYEFAFSIDDLKQNTQYVFSAYGMVNYPKVDITALDYVNTLLGQVIVKTPGFHKIKAVGEKKQSAQGSNLAFKISLSPDPDDIPDKDANGNPDNATLNNTSQYAIKEVKSVMLSLYKGKNPTEADLIQTVVVDVSGDESTGRYIDDAEVEKKLNQGAIDMIETDYSIKILKGYDGTSFRNEIDVDMGLFNGEIKASFPAVDKLSYVIRPITLLNIDDYLTKSAADEVLKNKIHGGEGSVGWDDTEADGRFKDQGEYDNLNPEVVLGYAISVQNLGGSVSLFDGVEYYVYDEQTYKNNLKGDNLNNSANFYTAIPDYMVKFSAPMIGSGAPTAVFLFDDMEKLNYDASNGSYSNAAEVEAVIKDRNNYYSSFPADKPCSVELIPGTSQENRMTRGHNYIFTVRLKSKSKVNDTDYYPELLDSDLDKVKVLAFTDSNKNVSISRAPYQTPKAYFWPLSSGTNWMKFGYYLLAPDPEAVENIYIDGVKGSTAMGGSAPVFGSASSSTRNTKPVLNKFGQELYAYTKNYDKQTMLLTYKTSLYTSAYNASYFAPLPTYFWETLFNIDENADNRPYFTVNNKAGENQTNLNRINLQLEFPSAEAASSVAGIKATVKRTDAGTPLEIDLPITSVTGGTVAAYLSLSDISIFQGYEVSISLTVYYDTNEIAMKPTDLEGNYYAIREQGKYVAGSYITMNQHFTGYYKRDNNASNSWFKLRDANYIKKYETLTQGRYVQGNVYVTAVLTDFFKNHFQTGYIDQGGMRGDDFDRAEYINYRKLKQITLNTKVEAEGAVTYEPYIYDFTTLNPMINFNDGERITIVATLEAAELSWKISGLRQFDTTKDIGTKDGTQDDSYKHVYFDLYKYNGTSYEPVLDADGNPIVIDNPVPVSLGDAQDGAFKTHIKAGGGTNGNQTFYHDLKLEHNTQYAVTAYYYKLGDNNSKQYLINEHIPEATTTQFYDFKTSDKVEWRNPKVTYSAYGYNQKYVNVEYDIGGQIDQCEVLYALYYTDPVTKEVTLVMDNDAIRAKDLSNPVNNRTKGSVSLMFNPESPMHDPVHDVDIDMTNIANYSLRFIPVSPSRTPFEKPENGTAAEVTAAYKKWIDTYYLGGETETGSIVYEVPLTLPALDDPYYYIKGVPQGSGNVAFNVSITDTSHVIVNDAYKLAVWKEAADGSWTDITTECGCSPTAVYNTETIKQVIATGITSTDKVHLYVYALHNDTNKKLTGEGGSLMYADQLDSTQNPSAAGFDRDALNLKANETAQLVEGDFSFGSTVAVGLPNNQVRVDFIDPVNIGNVKNIRFTITNPSGVARNISVSNLDWTTPISVIPNARYGVGINNYAFTENGQYTIGIRATIVDDNGTQRTKSQTITYYKAS
ncbi:MAG: hypothetical protein MJ131_08985 [Lachnospiraceae bacterium]|nr:hypothetical protein [Lachnospiraceae bacterium]